MKVESGNFLNCTPIKRGIVRITKWVEFHFWFSDPVTEVPRLEDWFSQNSHPSHQQICFYTEELNKLMYRHKFPKLEHKNVQFWFKNRRAKCKRLSAPPLSLHSAVSSSLAAAAGYTSASMSPHESRIPQSSPPI